MLQKNSDKIFVNTEDSQELADALAKIEAGDQVKFTGVATLQENSDGVAVLSIDDFNVVLSGEQAKGKKSGGKSTEDAESSDESTPEALADQGQDDSPAVQLARKRNSDAELGA